MKRNWIKKGIVAIIITAIFLAPFSGGVGINKVEAEQTLTPNSQNTNIKLSSGESIKLSTPAQGIGYASAIFDFNVIDLNNRDKTGYRIKASIFSITNDLPLTPEQEEAQIVSSINVRFTSVVGASKNGGNIRICYGFEKDKCTNTDTETVITEADTTTLKGDTDYKLKVKLLRSDISDGDTDYKLKVKLLRSDISDTATYFWTFRTGNKANNTSGNTTGDVKSYHNVQTDFGCSINPLRPNLGGCVLEIFYLLWQGTALIATLAGHFLDFFVYYSTDSASYKNEFVSQGWGAVRDVANIFFIIALLYVAIKTILGLNVTDNKKIVGAVIVIALIINFSLFTTKVVIDASNILAKVFYNNITSVDTKNNASTGNAGEKSISVGLVSKFDPQSIVMTAYNDGLGLGYAIFLVLLLMAVTLYTAYIFFSVALLFVARVVSLWIAMIFSPLAFISYALPFEIPEFGHKEWWDNLLKNAFLAPIFIFMLYIIVLFAGFLDGIVKYTSDPSLNDITNVMRRLMTMTVPFIILIVLLTMAKKIAVKFSGEMGAMIQKAGAMVGGLAVGAATGGMAMAGRATVGRVGEKIASSDWAIKRAKEGKFGAMNVGSALSKASFDARGIKIGGKGLADTGLKNVGKAKEGGYEKIKADQSIKRQKRAEQLDKAIDKGEAQKAVRKTESDLQSLLNTNQKALADLDKEIEIKRQALNDATATYGGGSDQSKTAGIALQNVQNKRKELREGGVYQEQEWGDVKKTRQVEKEVEGEEKEREVDTGLLDASKNKIMRKEKYREKEKKLVDEEYTEKGVINKIGGETIDYGNDSKYKTSIGGSVMVEVKNPNGTTKIGADGKPEMKEQKRTIAYLEKTELKERKQTVTDTKRAVRGALANKISSTENKIINSILHPLKYSAEADDEAAHKIKMEMKLDSDGKSH
jgi:hypothetical protein